jgi:O-methyltransferase domain
MVFAFRKPCSSPPSSVWPTTLSERPHDRFELATVTGANPAALGRLMRALCALGVFSESRSGHFSLASAGQFLRWRCWSNLLETVRNGTNATERLLGKQLFEFYATDAAESKIHDEAMRAISASHTEILLDAVDFRHASVVVDVGGGTGELLAAILTKNPDLRGVLFDRPMWSITRRAF